MKKYNITCLLVVMMWLVSCGSTAPFTERDAASKSIELAKSVESEKYAPDAYSTAVSAFEEGEGLIVKEGKSSQNDTAKEKYIESDTQAKSAYEKAVVPYIENFIQRTDEEIENGRSIKADVTFSEEFAESVSKNGQARDALNSKLYDQAKSSSLEAYDVIKQTIADTMVLREEVDLLDKEYASLLDELKNQKAEAAIPDEYAIAQENYGDLREQYEEGYYRELIPMYGVSILDAEELLLLIEEKRQEALEELKEAIFSLEQSKLKSSEVETGSEQ